MDEVKVDSYIVTDFPLKVVCPDCHAAITAKCTQRKLDGFEFVNWFHFSRIQKARDLGFGGENG